MRFETKDKIEPQRVHLKANKNYENCNFCAFLCVSSHAKDYVLNYIFPRLEDMRMKHLKPSFQRWGITNLYYCSQCRCYWCILLRLSVLWVWEYTQTKREKFLFCQLSCTMCVSRLWTKHIDLMHRRQFSFLTYKSRQFVLQHMNENSIQFSRNIPKTRFMLTWCPNCIITLNSFGSAQRMLRCFQHCFGSPQKIIRNLWKSLGRYGNPGYDKRKISHILTKKKLAVILILWSNIPKSFAALLLLSLYIS